MIESMVTATAHNIGNLVRGKAPDQVGTWNAVCLADSATGASPLSRNPRSRRAMSTGRPRASGCTWPRRGFEKYFIRKLRKGTSEPFYESLALKVLGIDKLKQTTKG